MPPAFVITTEACRLHLRQGQVPGLWEEVEAKLAALEGLTGKRFGRGEGKAPPLLVSVRSGAPVSMPGMMDTILNLGLTLEGVEALARATGNPRFAGDSFRRLLAMYGEVVLGEKAEVFEEKLSALKDRRRVKTDAELSPFDPTERLDEKGVGRLVRLAVEEGRRANPKLKLGLCGEHGGRRGACSSWPSSWTAPLRAPSACSPPAWRRPRWGCGLPGCYRAKPPVSP